MYGETSLSRHINKIRWFQSGSRLAIGIWEIANAFSTALSSRISPTYPWKIPRTLHQQFLKEFLSLWGLGEVWGIFPGYVGKIID